MAFKECARCGDRYFENFETYASCHQCGYFEELDDLNNFEVDPNQHYERFISTTIDSKAASLTATKITKIKSKKIIAKTAA